MYIMYNFIFMSLSIYLSVYLSVKIYSFSVFPSFSLHTHTQGKDGIPPEMIKRGMCVDRNTRTALLVLEGSLCHKICYPTISTFYKSKGDCIDCNRDRGMSLLSVVGKGFARVILT